MKLLLFMSFVFILTCKNETKTQFKEMVTKQQVSHEDIFKCLVNEFTRFGFTNNIGMMNTSLQINGSEFPDGKALLNTFYLKYPTFKYPDDRFTDTGHLGVKCELTFYEFLFNSCIADSTNLKPLFNKHSGLPFGASNRVLTYLSCKPGHYIIHLDTIKRTGYLLLFEIAAPRRDCTFINELSSCIKEILDLNDCEKIDSIMAKLKHEY